MYQRDTSAVKLQIQNEHIEIDIKLSSELAVINVNGSQYQISSWREPLNYGQGTHTYARKKALYTPKTQIKNRWK